jgi:outer membrane protein OmpA-like peptidoglycan-associated protein
LVGPAGQVGSQGAAGTQGATGMTGATGSSMQGSTGASGASGSAGLQGPAGQVGSQGPVGVVDRWMPYRSFGFDYGSASIRAVDERQVTDMASYLAQNPSLRLGIDDFMDPATASSSDQRLGERRVAAVRDALIRAGTPAYRIQTGAFSDPQSRRNQQVNVLLITTQ